MAQPLIAYAQRMLEGDASLAQIDHPVFIWEAGERRSDLESERVPTVSGTGGLHPTPGNPVVLPVRAESSQSVTTSVSLGRSETNDLVVENDSVSRLHALIHKDPRTQGWRITDVGSRNGTKVDGVPLEREQATDLPDGSEVVVGRVRLRFLHAPSFLKYLQAKLQP